MTCREEELHALPALEYEYYEKRRDHVDDIAALLVQDLVDIEQIQKGMQ